jgi:hypothetical protein
MMEVGRVLEIAERRDAVGLASYVRSLRTAQQRRAQGHPEGASGAQGQHMAA